MGTDQVAQHDLNKGYFERSWASLSPISKSFYVPRWNLLHSFFSAFPKVSFTALRLKHSSSHLRDASRTWDLSLSLWIVFSITHTVILFTDSRVLSNDLHLPPIIQYLLKIDDHSAPKCSKWKQPRKMGQVSWCNKRMWSTCSGTILGTEETSVSKTDKAPASWSSHFSWGHRQRERKGEKIGEGRQRKEKLSDFVLWWKCYGEYSGEWVRQASPESIWLSWGLNDTDPVMGIII